MKDQPFSFYSLVLGLGLFVVVLCQFSCWAASPNLPAATRVSTPIPITIASREPREVRVYLKSQHFGFYERGCLMFWGPVCSGRKGFETPKGKFRVRMKAKGYISKKYDALMPFAVQFTTAGHFLHIGEILRTPSSHGCVRLTTVDAVRIFRAVKLNDSVIITD